MENSGTLPSVNATASDIGLAANRDRAGPQTRVGGFALTAASRVGARDASRPGTHWAFRRGGCELAVDPSLYLQTEPMLQDPQFVWSRARQGIGTLPYAYASNNPLAFFDLNGLHDSNGCANASTCDACSKQAEKITDPKMRSCVIKQCVGKTPKLDCSEKRKEQQKCGPSDPKNPDGTWHTASAPQGRPESPAKEMMWCEYDMTPDCQTKTLVHELAHTCGWKEGAGGGVPSSQDLAPCKPK